MSVKNFEEMKREFLLIKPRGLAQNTLFYLAVGEETSEYHFDFLGVDIYRYLRDPSVTQADKLSLLGNLNKVVKAGQIVNFNLTGSSGDEHAQFHDWLNARDFIREPSNTGTHSICHMACSECGAILGNHFPDCTEF